MTITDVKGYPADDGGVERIDIEGESPQLDKLEVSLEVTGKQLKRSVTVRKDRTWTARFKASDGVDLLGFNCGTLVKAGASSRDDAPQHVVWTGCVRCVTDDEEAGADAEKAEQSASSAPPESDGQPVHADGQPVEGSSEPIVLVRRGEGEGDQAVVTVTVGRQASGAADRQGPRTDGPAPPEKRTRRRPRRQSRPAPEASHEEPQHERPDDEPDPRRRREPSDALDDERPEAETPEREQPVYAEREEEPRHRSRRERRDDQRPAPRDDGQSDSERRAPERESVSWMLGSLVALTTAGLLVAIAAQAFPVMVGLATALVVPTWALVLAGHTPASWARWTAAGVGLAALAIPSLMPFLDVIAADVYLVAAGIAALGIAIAAGLLFFRSGDENEDD